MTLRDALKEVYERHGVLTPSIVVEEARAGRGETADFLRQKLEWDNEVAGERYRIEQARQLIRQVRVVYREADDESPERDVRRYHAIPDEDQVGGFSFIDVDQILLDPVKTRMLEAAFRREIRSLKERFGALKEYGNIVRQELLAGVEER